MKSSILTYSEEEKGGITGNHVRKIVAQTSLEAGWTSENMVMGVCGCLFFSKSLFLKSADS